jgi:broad specificity phosphatase PhoE
MKQAQEAGKQLREKISEKDAKVVFYFSPYLRTKQNNLIHTSLLKDT